MGRERKGWESKGWESKGWEKSRVEIERQGWKRDRDGKRGRDRTVAGMEKWRGWDGMGSWEW